MTATIADRPSISVRDSIDKLFEPKSIAIIGASADPTKLGSSPLTAMNLLGFDGRISVVNPRYDELMGHKCYGSIDALPDDIDVAMIVLPAAGAVDAADALAAKGVKAMVMIPQGFGEAGGEGLERDKRLLTLADQGVAITGPNTNGIANVARGVAMSIGPIFQYAGAVKPGRVSLVSQSGAMVSSLLTKLNQCGIGIGKSATCGNELILNVADYIDYLVDDPATDIIVVYLETIRDMPAFKAAIAKARDAGKPIVYLVGTPAFCQTGICGPVLDVMMGIVDDYPDLRFIHAEVYTDNTATQAAPAVAAAGLSFEPVIFLTDASGTVVERLDVIVDESELREQLAALS